MDVGERIKAIEVGERIKAAREKAGLTQAELGSKIGVSGVTIMRYEKGWRQPRFEQLDRIADVLGIRSLRLLSDEDLGMSILDSLRDRFGSSEDFYRQFVDNPFIVSTSVDDMDMRLFNSYGLLNEEGKKEAVKRIEELTEIPRYRAQDPTLESVERTDTALPSEDK